jgi:RNA polymerase II C-terminal domain phosphatase-like 3/4
MGLVAFSFCFVLTSLQVTEAAAAALIFCTVSLHQLDSRVRHLVFEEKGNANGRTKANPVDPPGHVSSGRLPFESGAAYPFSGSSSLPRLEIPARNKISPLLDLHADYDENSLPSPTRDNAPSFPVPRPIEFGAFPMAPEQSSFPERVDPAKNSLYPSISDPLKAVSSYQQKYGQKSVFPSDDLPSPTPSGDEGKCADKGSDIFGEVSSFSVSKTNALPSTSPMPTSRPSSIGGSSGDGYSVGRPGYSKQVEQLAAGLNPILKTTAKSRDPRLRFLNRDSFGATEEDGPANFAELKDGNMAGGSSVNNRKQKSVDEPKVVENMLKRPRSGTADPRDILVPTGNPSLGINNQLINNTSSTINNNRTNTKILQPPQITVPQSSAAPVFSLPAVLKDIAGNPTMIMHLIQMEQKMSSSEPQLNVAATSGISGGMSSSMSMVTAGTVLPPGSAPQTTEVAQVPSVRPQVPIQQLPLVSLLFVFVH